MQGVKFFDVNGDGVQDATEPGLADWTVWVDVDGDGVRDGREPFAVTDSDGNYSINNVLPGTYVVYEQPQPQWVLTYPAASSHQLTVEPGLIVTGNDFGDAIQTWHNPIQPLDTNFDTFISPIDALLIINRLNRDGSGPLAPPPIPHTAPPPFVDTSDDGFLSPIDCAARDQLP